MATGAADRMFSVVRRSEHEFDTAAISLLYKVLVPNRITATAFMHSCGDHHRVAIGDQEGFVTILRGAEDVGLLSLEVIKKDRPLEGCYGLAAVADGGFVGFEKRGDLHHWDTAWHKVCKVPVNDPRAEQPLTVRPLTDNTVFVACSKCLLLWDLRNSNATQLSPFTGSTAISAEALGEFVAAIADVGGCISAVDIRARKQLWQVDLNEVGAARASGGLSASRRGRLAAACENGTVVCVDEATAQSKPSVTFMGNTPFPATTVLLSPIGQTSSQKADHGPMLTGGSDGTVTSWVA